MKLSIIMLVYNHERFIAQALESVLMQKTDFEYELIIGEDCSSDGSREIIRSYEKRFEGKMKPLYRDKNLGMAGNLMDCLMRCTGQYIAVLEGDDFWTDDKKLQKQAAFLDEHPEYVMAVHNWNIVSGSGAFVEAGSDSREFKVFGKEDLQRYDLPGQTSTIFVRNPAADLKEKYMKILKKYFWIPPDRSVSLILLSCGKIAVLPDVMSSYRYYVEENGTNWSSKHDTNAKRNYLYAYLTAMGMEWMSRDIGYPVDMTKAKVNFFKTAGAARRWDGERYKHKMNFYRMLMLLAEPHRIRMIKAIRRTRKIY